MRLDCREGKRRGRKRKQEVAGFEEEKTRPGNGCFYAHAVFHYTDKGGGDILGCLIVFCSHREMCFLFASLALVCCGFFVTFSRVVDGVLAPGIRQQSGKKTFFPLEAVKVFLGGNHCYFTGVIMIVASVKYVFCHGLLSKYAIGNFPYFGVSNPFLPLSPPNWFFGKTKTFLFFAPNYAQRKRKTGMSFSLFPPPPPPSL